LRAPAERERWDAFRRARLAPGSGLASPDLGRFEADLATLRAQHAGDGTKLALLDRLEAWRAQIGLRAAAPGTDA
jgi:exodeoxyribonuclease-1